MGRDRIVTVEFGQDGLGELLTELDSPLVPDDVPLFQLRRVEWFRVSSIKIGSPNSGGAAAAST